MFFRNVISVFVYSSNCRPEDDLHLIPEDWNCLAHRSEVGLPRGIMKRGFLNPRSTPTCAPAGLDFEATSIRDDLFLGGYLTEHKMDQASSAAVNGLHHNLQPNQWTSLPKMADMAGHSSGHKAGTLSFSSRARPRESRLSK